MFFGEICNSIRGKIDCRQKNKPKSDRLLETYLSRTRALAEQAIVAFENAPRTKFANSLQTGAIAPKKGTPK